MTNPLQTALDRHGVVVLDGGLASELERRGADLQDPLWSAKILVEQPNLIRDVHADYFAAGAMVATTASYQATFPGFAERGLTREQGAELMRRSVQLAGEARTLFSGDRSTLLVAASVGPYGAYLADGSEFRGDYGLSVAALMDFHRPRLEVLAASGADLIACETIPSLAEGEALVRLLAEFPGLPAWLSFSCRDDAQVCHGEDMADCATLVDQCEQIVAVGVNCTSPRYVESLLRRAATATAKPLLAYPNRGETWDAVQRCWLPQADLGDFAAAVDDWVSAGARLIGGCCRTTPDDIRAIARRCTHPNNQ